jgi:hypothetical protein
MQRQRQQRLLALNLVDATNVPLVEDRVETESHVESLVQSQSLTRRSSTFVE